MNVGGMYSNIHIINNMTPQEILNIKSMRR